MAQPSIWEKETFYSHKEVIIVGSGFVGLWSAYYLKKQNPKWNILMVDKGIIPTGASTRNAGFACFGSVTELVNDARKMGEQNMLQLVQWRYEGLQRIRQTFSKKEIDFEKNGGYELITPLQYNKLSALKNDIGWLNILLRKAIGEKRVFRMADDKIKDFGFNNISHLIENKLEGQLHSAKLLLALQNKVQQMGVHILNNVDVLSYQKTHGMVELETNLPIKISCDQLLVCTNAFAKKLLPQLVVEPARGQVLVTSPIKKLSLKGTFHFDEGFYYFRNLGNRVLLGGARNKAFDDERTDALETTPHIQNELENFLKETILHKQHFKIEHRWSGIMAMGDEKMPIVKKVKGNIYCAVRMSGMGVALAPVVGEQVAHMMSR